MKTIKLTILTLLTLLAGINQSSAQAPLNQYSSIRKSMPQQQMNPAWSFARKMAAKSSKPILLVVQARGGTSIKLWVKDAPRLKYTHSDDLGREGEMMPEVFDEAVRRTRQAMQYGQLKGILWHQGESDSDPGKAETYMDNLVLLVSQLREALDAPDVPFVAGEIQEHHQTPPTFNPIIRSISSQIPNSSDFDYLYTHEHKTISHINHRSVAVSSARHGSESKHSSAGHHSP